MIWLFAAAQAASFTPQPAYRMEVKIASVTKVPVFGETHVRTTSTLLTRLEERDGRWVQTLETCQIRIEDSSKLATTVIPDTFVARVPVQELTVDLSETDGGWTYSGDPGPTHVGYDPRLTGDQVPERQNDAGVIDWDEDGEPGATVHLKVPVFGWVELYIAQRSHTVFSGSLSRDGTGGGSVDIRSLDQRTLGASVGLFRTNTQVRPDPAASFWTVEPLEAGTRCEDLRDGIALAP